MRKIDIKINSCVLKHETCYVENAPLFSETGDVVVDANLHPLKSNDLMADDYDLQKLILAGVELDTFVATAQRSRFGLINSIH